MMLTTDSSIRPDPALRHVARIYAVWGRRPWLYAAQDWLTFLGRHRRIRRAAARALGVGKGARILEVGCGTGRNFRYVQDLIRAEGEIVAFDYSEEMLDSARALCRRKGWNNVRFVQGDAAKLDVGPAGFDGVLCVLALSAIPDHTNTLKRCREVLRPGGVLAVCDAKPFSGLFRFLNPIARLLYIGTTNWHPDRDVPAAIRAEFGEVETREFNAGSFYVARAVKRGAGGSDDPA